MNSLEKLSIGQLKQAVALREQIDLLQSQLAQVLNGDGMAAATPKRTMSAVTRARMAAAAQARWAGKKEKPTNGRRKMSASARAAISAAAKARWKKIKAAGGSRL